MLSQSIVCTLTVTGWGDDAVYCEVLFIEKLEVEVTLVEGDVIATAVRR